MSASMMKNADTIVFVDTDSAKQIVNDISKTIADYSSLLAKLEQERMICEEVDNELKRIGMHRGFSEEEWQKGITLKDRWKVEERLYRSNNMPTPPNDTVLQYLRSALDSLSKYSEVLGKIASGELGILTLDECNFLITRYDVHKQLSPTVPMLEKPFNVANGDQIAIDIEAFCEKNTEVLSELVKEPIEDDQIV